MKDLSLHILDLVQNAVTAKANCIEISVQDTDNENLIVKIKDNGSGIPAEMLKTIDDPYTTGRTTRKVGLGIPLFKQSAERTDGSVKIDSKVGQGTTIEAYFKKQHIDCLPLGDIPGVVALLVNANPNLNFIYTHQTPKNNYTFKTVELKEVLGETPINDPEIHRFIKEMIAENLEELYKLSN